MNADYIILAVDCYNTTATTTCTLMHYYITLALAVGTHWMLGSHFNFNVCCVSICNLGGDAIKDLEIVEVWLLQVVWSWQTLALIMSDTLVDLVSQWQQHLQLILPVVGAIFLVVAVYLCGIGSTPPPSLLLAEEPVATKKERALAKKKLKQQQSKVVIHIVANFIPFSKWSRESNIVNCL